MKTNNIANSGNEKKNSSAKTNNTGEASSDNTKKTEHIPQDGTNENITDMSDLMLKAPIIPEEIYELLPEVLKDGSEMFQTQREKDVFITSALTVISGCFPTIAGLYANRKVSSNLFSFVIAPAASGKSALAAARDVAMVIHDGLHEDSEAEYSLTDGSANPPRKVLLIPGNISAAAIISLLNENNGVGIICEPEADTLSNSLKQDFGGFSDLLRKAFHHESVSYSRKKNNEYIEIKNPRLSLSLSGTPNQVPALVKSVNDGLFSRFIFYIFRNQPKWRDVSPQSDIPVYDEYISNLQQRIKYIYNIVKDTEYEFDLTIPQWIKLNHQYSKTLREKVTFIGTETSSTVMRLGLIQYRIAMILSILRHFENYSDEKIVCTDVDYEISEALSDVYLEHALLVYRIMAKKLNSGLQGNIEKFFNSLPIIPFKRKDAVLIGEKLEIAPRTVTKYLKRLLENNYLSQETAQGPYIQIRDN